MISAARWLGQKVDLFVDAATKTAGAAAGFAGVGATGYVLHQHFPDLAHQIRDLIDAG